MLDTLQRGAKLGNRVVVAFLATWTGTRNAAQYETDVREALEVSALSRFRQKSPRNHEDDVVWNHKDLSTELQRFPHKVAVSWV